MDADTRLSDRTAGAGKCAKGDHKGAYSETIPFKTSRQGHLRVKTSADSHAKVRIRSPAARAAKARKRTTREIGKKCGKITNPSAQVVLTSPPASSSSEVAPPGLPAPVKKSANSENVVALEVILRGVLSPGGSSESARATTLATLARSAGYVVRQKNPVFAARDQTIHLSMVVDSGAEEVNLVWLAHKHLMKNVTKLTVPLQLETAGGDLTLDTIGDLLCGGIVCHGCVFNPPLSVRHFTTARGEKD